MELDFDPDQEDLRDSVRAFLAAECPIALVRDIVEARIAGGSAAAGPLQEQMRALGWPALTVPEPAGGLGMGAVELALLAEELGRALTPGPLLATLSQYVPTVVELGTPDQQAALLRPVAEGSVSGTLAIAEPTGAVDPATTTVVATPTSEGFTIRGTKSTVMEPAPGGMMIVVARTPDSAGDDGVGAFVVAAAATAIEPLDAFDPSRVLATVRFDDVRVSHDARLGPPGTDSARGLRRAGELATVALALDAVGAANRLFDDALAYVGEREQFGVPVGSFQALKHKFADMLILLERARALGYFAALTIAEDDERRTVATAMAKAAAGDAATRIAKEGIQVHGGIGYTWESDVHLYVRRLQSDAVLFGTATQHRSRVADLLGV
jgi:alkylation response protein AidB-like acyl-CoA dehydrogenase